MPAAVSADSASLHRPKLALQGLTPEALSELVPGVPLDDARRVVAQVHREGGLRTPNPLVRKVVREAVLAAGEVPTLDVVSTQASAHDPFVKLALRTSDQHVVETVRIPLEKQGRFSVCVSSQVGCALACAFCATGRLGLIRNLESWEIIEQVRVVRATLDPKRRERVHGVVFQGMGEPLANLDRVLAAIDVMCCPSALAIDARCIMVCTSGLPSGIRKLAERAPRVRLGLSIGSALGPTRRHLMPIEASHPFEDVMAAVIDHAKLTSLSPMWAVTLLDGVNDSTAHAHALADWVARFRDATGRSPRISILAYNSIGFSDDGAPDPFVRVTSEKERQFRDALAARSVFTHKRYSGGSDVAAACGQLAARSEQSARRLRGRA